MKRHFGIKDDAFRELILELSDESGESEQREGVHIRISKVLTNNQCKCKGLGINSLFFGEITESD